MFAWQVWACWMRRCRRGGCAQGGVQAGTGKQAEELFGGSVSSPGCPLLESSQQDHEAKWVVG